MDKQRVIEILREHEAELKGGGLLHLQLFGSVARGEETPESDVDLLFDYDETDSWHLFGAYAFQERVSELLGIKAHLSSAKHIRRDSLRQLKRLPFVSIRSSSPVGVEVVPTADSFASLRNDNRKATGTTYHQLIRSKVYRHRQFSAD